MQSRGLLKRQYYKWWREHTGKTVKLWEPGTLLVAGPQNLAVYRELKESREPQASPCRNIQRIHSADQSIQQLVNVMSKGNKPNVPLQAYEYKGCSSARGQNRQGWSRSFNWEADEQNMCRGKGISLTAWTSLTAIAASQDACISKSKKHMVWRPNKWELEKELC